MAELDLRALSAPLQILLQDVVDAYGRLDAKWTAVTEALDKFPIPGVPSCMIWNSPEHDDYSCLEYKKVNGKKRVCITQYRDAGTDIERVSTTPYEEWSVEQRMSMLDHVPGLFESAQALMKKFIAQMQ